MFWRRRTRRTTRNWPVDPERVQFGSLAAFGREASREGVALRLTGEREARFVPFARFRRDVEEALARGRRMRVEELRVAPILRRRHAAFFDRLTDWGPATRRAVDRADRAHARFRRALDSYS